MWLYDLMDPLQTRGLGSIIWRNGQPQPYGMNRLSFSFPKLSQRRPRSKWFSFYHEERKRTIMPVFVNICSSCSRWNCTLIFGESLFLKYYILGEALWYKRPTHNPENNCQAAFNLDYFFVSYAIFQRGCFFMVHPLQPILISNLI